jgi:hypothetical protein
MSVPTRRPLRIYPFDPEVDRRGRSVVADVPYERVGPGPVGRLVRVVDYDPQRDCFYRPIELDSREVLLNGGLDLAVHDPQFHQQMVYAVVMRVLDAFEGGLGAPFDWRGQRRLLVIPHAAQGSNAFFDPELFALVFGYFPADESKPGTNMAGEIVYTCLSHDVIAHETTHAVLHRLRPNYSISTNRDVLGFHEGFADIVALLQRFSYRDLVAEQIRATQGNLAERNLLVEFATQFGQALGQGKALRSMVETPSATDYTDADEEHDLGNVLAAAVIDGFLRSTNEASADLIRLATAGTGVLQPGALHPVLVDELTDVAVRTAQRVLGMCIRAFDFLPPVDLTFGDYLRALVTADFDLYPSDDRHLRANLVEAFRIRGITPQGVSSLAEGSLRLEPVAPGTFDPLPFPDRGILSAAMEFDRRERWRQQVEDDNTEPIPPESNRDKDARALVQGTHATTGSAIPDRDDPYRLLYGWAVKHREKLGLVANVTIASSGVHGSLRVDADGYPRAYVVAQFTQRDDRSELDESLGGIQRIGGVTVVADPDGAVRYVVTRPYPVDGSNTREELQSHVDTVERRIGAAAWAAPRATRLSDRLNLRGVDAFR